MKHQSPHMLFVLDGIQKLDMSWDTKLRDPLILLIENALLSIHPTGDPDPSKEKL